LGKFHRIYGAYRGTSFLFPYFKKAYLEKENPIATESKNHHKNV